MIVKHMKVGILSIFEVNTSNECDIIYAGGNKIF